MTDYNKNGIEKMGANMLVSPFNDYALVFNADGTAAIVSDPFDTTNQKETIALGSTGIATFANGAVFSGSATFSGTTALPTGTTVAAGTGSETGTLTGTIHVDTTVTTSAATSKTTIVSYSLPANSLSANGKGVRILAWGSCAANGNNKTVTIDVGAGGTTVATTGAVANNNGAWRLDATLVRTGAATSISSGTAISAATAANTVAADTSSWSAACTIALTATNGTASDDTIFKGWMIQHLS